MNKLKMCFYIQIPEAPVEAPVEVLVEALVGATPEVLRLLKPRSSRQRYRVTAKGKTLGNAERS